MSSEPPPPVAPCAFRYTYFVDKVVPGLCSKCGRTLAEMKTCPYAMAVQRYLEGER